MSLEKLIKTKIISEDFSQKVKYFVNKNIEILSEEKIALVHWDTHFDNIIIKNKKISGMLDFEKIDLDSIDFVLDIIKRMISYPTKYMSEKSEKFAKKEDYKDLLIWFKEFYPKLFNFQHPEKRLNLYSIEHDINALTYYPKENSLKNAILKNLEQLN